MICCIACGTCALHIKAPKDEELDDGESELPPLVQRIGGSSYGTHAQLMQEPGPHSSNFGIQSSLNQYDD